MYRRIVILENDEDIRELFSVFLQEHGFEVHLFSRVFESPSDVERLAPDLMIIDVFIGATQEGWEFVHQLKAYPPSAQIPLILYGGPLCQDTKIGSNKSYSPPFQ